MMKTLYLGLLFIMVVLVLSSAGAIYKRKDDISRSIFWLFVVGVFAITANSAYVMGHLIGISTFFHSIFLASIDWLLLLMFRYTWYYTEGKIHFHQLKWVIYAFATGESLNMIANVKFHHVFRLEEAYSDTFGSYFAPVEYGVSFYVHLAFCYILVLVIFALLIDKFRKTPRIYRKKYGAIILCFFLVVLFDAIGLCLNLAIDISLLFYCAACLAIYFFSLYYVPRNISDTILKTAVQMVDMGVGCFDISGKCIYLNNRGKQMIQNFKNFSLQDDYTVLENYFNGWLERHWKQGDEEQAYVEKFTVAGRTYSYEFNIQKLIGDDEEFLGFFINCMDRTEEFETYEEAHFKATHDMLTGIFNEQYFEQKVHEMISKYPDEDFMMLTSDIKDFKLVNDLFGTEKGDEVLKMHAELCRKYAGEKVVYGRLGEDRFAYLMPKVRYSEGVFEKAMNEIVEKFTNDFFKMQIYIGVYEVVDKTEPIFVMIDKCNLAITTIKGDYSVHIAIYDDSLFKEEMEKNAIINGFDSALAKGEFGINLQPQMDRDEKLIGAEALARWHHPENGIIMPQKFVPILEKAGLIYRLDLQMWDLAAKQLAEWKAKGREDLFISVNISAQDQYYVDIYKALTGLVEKYDISPFNLKLEITESIFITEVRRHLGLLERLQDYGFQIGIDDFGSGYSSLNILKDISADVIKIDMEFIQATGNIERSKEIIASIIQLAKKLNMYVITEGVENKDQVDMLKEMGCDAFQGFYYSEPIPAEEFEDKYLQ